MKESERKTSDDWDKLELIQNKFPRALSLVARDLDGFISFLRRLR